MSRALIRYFASLVIVTAIALGAWYVLIQPQERITVNILGSREPELGIPVYAQFVVTQRLTADMPIPVKRITIPMYISEGIEPTVRLLANGTVIREWQSAEHAPTNTGIADMMYEFGDPLLIGGEYEIQIDGKAIAHDAKDTAPRIFVETEDANYPGGNYRIAQNEKQGDVALTITEQKPTWRYLLAAAQENPLNAVILAVPAGILFIAVIRIPFILLGKSGDSRRNNDPQKKHN